MDYRFYLLIAVITGICCYNAIDYLTAKHKVNYDEKQFQPNNIYKVLMSIFVGLLWMPLLPSAIAVFILHECILPLSKINWKDAWQTIKDTVKGWFKRKEKKND